MNISLRSHFPIPFSGQEWSNEWNRYVWVKGRPRIFFWIPDKNSNYKIDEIRKWFLWVGIIFNELIAWIISTVSSFDILANGVNKHWENSVAGNLKRMWELKATNTCSLLRASPMLMVSFGWHPLNIWHWNCFLSSHLVNECTVFCIPIKSKGLVAFLYAYRAFSFYLKKSIWAHFSLIKNNLKYSISVQHLCFFLSSDHLPDLFPCYWLLVIQLRRVVSSTAQDHLVLFKTKGYCWIQCQSWVL